MKLVRETLESIPVERPVPNSAGAQNLCLDKGYAYDEVRDTVADLGLPLHRLEQRRRRVEELFRDDADSHHQPPGEGAA